MKTKLIIFLAILIPFILVYRTFFINTYLAFGDAPYFYQENLKELFNKPLIWNDRNDNFGANQNYILWIFFPTFLYGVLHNFFNLQNDFLIRLVFLFPATLLSILGMWLFVGKFTKSSAIRLLGSMLYGFNTYFLLIIDGGQIGVALSYGLFPCTVFLLDKYLNTSNLKNYSLSLISLTTLFAADIRIFILLPIFLFIFFVFEQFTFNRLQLFASMSQIPRLIKNLAFLFLPIILINLFWIIPLISNLQGTVNYFNNTNVINLITLTNSILLFQPHFPLNEFGHIFPTPFYFGLIPLLLLIGLFFADRTKDPRFTKKYLDLILMFLLFAFLAKGGSDPFGSIYTWILQYLPLGIIFRDSSKFFIPLIFSASCLLVLSIESLNRVLNRKLLYSLVAAIYIYLLLLIYPAVIGNLQGFLGGSNHSDDYRIVYNNIKDQPGFFRTLWFPERPPLAFSSWSKPALSANTLFKEKPFASMIQGNYDLFFFLHDPMLQDWLRLFGVKYVFFPEDFRKKVWTDQQKQDRNIFLNFADDIFAGLRLNWPTSFSGYEIKGGKDLIFTQKKVVLVVGGMDVYSYLKTAINLDISSNGFIFLEDGIVDPEKLISLSSQSAVLVFKDRSVLDLTMSFLQNNFIDLNQIKQDSWGIYNAADYLKWKDGLQTHNIETSELGFNRDLIFSSVKGETTSLDINIVKDGDYYLAFRHIEASGSSLLKVDVAGVQQSFISSKSNSFKWDLIGPVFLVKGTHKLFLENLGDFEAVNAVALVTTQDMDLAKSKAMQLTNSIPLFDLSNTESIKQLQNSLSEPNNTNVTYSVIDPTNFKLTLNENNPTWVIFSEHFDPRWKIVGNEELEPLPFYSMINGYWVDGSQKELVMKYLPQDQVDKYVTVSQLSGVILLFCLSLALGKKLLKK